MSTLLERRPIAIIACIASLSGLLFGLDVGLISGAQNLIFQTLGIDASAKNTAVIRGFIVSCVPLGAFVGAVLSGLLAGKLGRRRSLMLTAVCFLIGTGLLISAYDVDRVLIGRLLMGLGVGIAAMVGPMYLGEIAPPKVRGAAVLSFQLAITLGILLGFCLNYVAAHGFMGDPYVAWRALYCIEVVVSLALLIGMLPLPESPRWLFLRGREESARDALKLVCEKADIQDEVAAIHASLHHQQLHWSNLFRLPIVGIAALSFMLFVFQQLSGINAIMYYGASVFEQAGFGAQSKFLAQALMGVMNVIMTVASLRLVDGLGRQKTLYIGMAGMVLCLGGLGYILKYPIEHGAYWAFAAILGYIFFFSPSLGGVPYVMMAEVFPLNIRAAGMAMASSANWAFNVLISQTFTIFESSLGMSNVFWGYAVFTFVGLIFAWAYVPETKGRSLERIEENLYNGRRLKHLGD